MNWFYDLKISTKLILSFSVIAILAGVNGYIGVNSLNAIEQSDAEMYENMTVPISQMTLILNNFQKVRVGTRDLLLTSDKTKIDAHIAHIRACQVIIAQNFAEFEKRIISKEMREIFEGFAMTRKKYREDLDKYILLISSGKKEEAETYLNGNMQDVGIEYEKNIERLVEVKIKDASDKSDANTSLAVSSSNLMIGFMITVVILSLFLGILIAKIISRSLIRGVEFSKAISEGNLTERLDDKLLCQKDEIGTLAKAMNNMVVKLTEVVQSVQSASENVASGSQELSANSEQMSQGATEQAAAAEEASSSMEQMVSNIKQNTDNAHQTEKIALKSAEDAKEGGKAVIETVQAMKDIANKISIIEEIARQTNLLALNAAIEAARAGEHGKGFAVVAAEVRKLAERSQVAAGEINKLSASSVQVAERAGELFSRIVPDIQKTSELIQEISASSIEQNTGVEQINNAIQQLNQVIQQNAAASEEMASTSEELNSQAEQLIGTMSFFNIGANEKKTEYVNKNRNIKPIEQRLKTNYAKRPYNSEKENKTSINGRNGRGLKIDLSQGSDRPEQDFERF